MNRNYTLDEDNRIVSTTEFPFREYSPNFHFPNGFDFDNQFDYKIENGELVYVPTTENRATV